MPSSPTLCLMVRTYPLDDPRLVATWTQLRRAGHSPGRIKAQLAAGRWRRWGYAIVLHSGPLSREQRWFVARAHGGPRALLTGFTAAEVYGLRGWERDPVHLLVPANARVVNGCPLPVVIHRTRHWPRVPRNATAPVHGRAGALLVAAASFDTPRPACGILAAAVQQRVTTAARLSDALELAPRLRHRAAVRAALLDIAQGADALSEIDFVSLCRRHGLPAPMQQRVRVERSGRRRYLDASWLRRDGRLVVAEVDGALHLAPRRWWDDQLRQNELALADALVLRFPSVVVRTEPALVVAQLRRALRL